MGAAVVEARDYTVAEVAGRMQVSARTVRTWVGEGLFVSYKLPGRGGRGLLRIDAVSFEGWRKGLQCGARVVEASDEDLGNLVDRVCRARMLG